MKLYEYMIIYVFDSGLGRIQFTRSEPIRSYDDVVKVEKVINGEKKLDNLFITYFKLLRVYEEKENERDSKYN